MTNSHDPNPDQPVERKIQQHGNNLWSHRIKDKRPGKNSYICVTFQGTLKNYTTLAVGHEMTEELAEEFLMKNIELQLIHTGLRYPDATERRALAE
jgi:hypothetical protein